MNIDEAVITEKLRNRDLSIDFIRVFAILLVVVLHTLMVGLTVTSDGLKQENPLEEASWFPIASWFGQIMPLFFMAGGFASWVGYQSLLRKGGAPKDYVRSRAIRLLYPVAIFYGIFFTAISLAVVVFHVDAGLMNMFLSGIGMPLWFVVAYLICQFSVPLLAKLHSAHPYITIASLIFGAVLVDVVKTMTGQDWVGWFNLLFVWTAVQQLGFFVSAPPARLKTSRWFAAVGVVVGFGLTWLTTLVGYNPNMLANLNPPALPLIFIGIAQTCLFLLIRGLIRKLMTVTPVRNFTLLVGTRAMTIYLWHLPVIVALSSLVLVFPDFIPNPSEGSIWWIYRAVILIPVVAIVFLITLVLAKYEAGPQLGVTPKWVPLMIGLVLGLVAPFTATELGLSYSQVVWGAVLLAISVVLLVGRRVK